MAFTTDFNITWNQRVNKEETSYLKFMEQRKKDEEAKKPQASAPSRRRAKQRAMSDADLMSAVRNARESVDGSGVGAPNTRSGRNCLTSSESDLMRTRSNERTRSRSSTAGRSVLQQAGSTCSSTSVSPSKRAPPMTFSDMQEHVFNQYMNGYIKDLEKEAKEAAAESELSKQKIKDGLQLEIDEKSQRRVLAQQNAKQVQEQIEENKQRRATTRKQFVEAASAHNFPLFTETFISQDEVDEYRKKVKEDFREELNNQHTTTQTLKNILVKRDKIYAAEKLATNLKNMIDDHKFEHEEKLRKGNEMKRVWDRDIRLKNIKNSLFRC